MNLPSRHTPAAILAGKTGGDIDMNKSIFGSASIEEKLMMALACFVFAGIPLLVIKLVSPESFKSESNNWEPLLPESEKKEWDCRGQVPFFVCPRCHSSNTEEDFSAAESHIAWNRLASREFVHHYRCRYCGNKFTSKTYSGRNPRW